MNTVIRKSVKSMDIEFAQNLRILSKIATTNHAFVKYCISRNIELYIQKKIDMELANSFQKIFK